MHGMILTSRAAGHGWGGAIGAPPSFTVPALWGVLRLPEAKSAAL